MSTVSDSSVKTGPGRPKQEHRIAALETQLGGISSTLSQLMDYVTGGGKAAPPAAQVANNPVAAVSAPSAVSAPASEVSFEDCLEQPSNQPPAEQAAFCVTEISTDAEIQADVEQTHPPFSVAYLLQLKQSGTIAQVEAYQRSHPAAMQRLAMHVKDRNRLRASSSAKLPLSASESAAAADAAKRAAAAKQAEIDKRNAAHNAQLSPHSVAALELAVATSRPADMREQHPSTRSLRQQIGSDAYSVIDNSVCPVKAIVPQGKDKTTGLTKPPKVEDRKLHMRRETREQLTADIFKPQHCQLRLCVLDCNGQPVLGANGQPYVAITLEAKLGSWQTESGETSVMYGAQSPVLNVPIGDYMYKFSGVGIYLSAQQRLSRVGK